MAKPTVTCEHKVQKITDADRERGYVVVEQEYAEVKRVFQRAITDGVTNWPTQPVGQELLEKWMNSATEHSSFYGDKPMNTNRYIREGFFSEAFETATEGVLVTKKARFIWDESEGECDANQLLAGSDTPFLHLVKREAKPGIRLEIDFSFNCHVRADTIRDYGAWCCGLIAGLEAKGYDMEIVFDMSGAGVFHDHGIEKLLNFLVVKRFGEKSNFTEWSALFSPGGFRHIGFTAIPVACDKLGVQVRPGLGRAFGRDGWGVTWTPITNILRITADQQSDNQQFPHKELTAAAIDTELL